MKSDYNNHNHTLRDFQYFKSKMIYRNVRPPIRTNKWSQGPDMNDARKRHSSVVYRDRLYVLGGTDAEGNSMEVLELKRNYPTRPYQSGESFCLISVKSCIRKLVHKSLVRSIKFKRLLCSK